jgi:hypothetical protein
MKHTFLMTTAVLAIAIPLVLGATGIINPSVAYANTNGGGDEEKRIQINKATASNTATQSNSCGNESIVALAGLVLCANSAEQSNTISQSQSYTGNGGGGDGEEKNVQVNRAEASNTAEQSNDCGNGSAVIGFAAVACVNSASQSNSITQSQSIDEG